MFFEVEVSLEFKESFLAKIIFESLLPEVLNPSSSGVSVSMKCIPPKILIHFSSNNPLLLRAALNSLIRLTILLEQILKNLQ